MWLGKPPHRKQVRSTEAVRLHLSCRSRVPEGTDPDTQTPDEGSQVRGGESGNRLPSTTHRGAMSSQAVRCQRADQYLWLW